MDPISQPQASDKLWTPANVVTLVRICLVPVFVAALISPWPEWFGLPIVAGQAKELIAAGIFILISCTDWLDGYLARSRGEVTDFGKFMDPLADKILVVAALLVLVELGSLPSWVVLIIVAREFIVSGVRMVAASKNVVIAASWYGKFKTVSQMVAIVLFVVKDSYMVGTAAAAFSDALWLASWGVMAVALVLTIVSMLDYIAKARDLIGLGSHRRRSGQGGPEAGDAADADAPACPPEELERRAARLIDAARAAGMTLGTAESLTGGMVCQALTAVPGSSDAVRGGVASYAAAVKHDVLGVPAEVIERDGVVSEPCARAMAEGARALLRCDVCVAVTGIAGPGGAEPGKPVGTVWAACAGPGGTVSRLLALPGGRDAVRRQTAAAALEMLEEALAQGAPAHER